MFDHFVGLELKGLNKSESSFVNDNKIFWKNIKPFFLDKGKILAELQFLKVMRLFLIIPKSLNKLNLFSKVLFCYYTLKTCNNSDPILTMKIHFPIQKKLTKKNNL